MKTLKLLAVTIATVTAIGLSFGASAQEAAPQGATPQDDPALTAAAIAVNKLALMGNDGAFPLTQDEINAAANYLIDQAKSDGQTLTRDQAIIGIGYLAGSLAAFLDMEKSGALPPPDAVPEDQLPPPDFSAPAPAPNAQPAPAPAAPATAPVAPAPTPAPAPVTPAPAPAAQ